MKNRRKKQPNVLRKFQVHRKSRGKIGKDIFRGKFHVICDFLDRVKSVWIQAIHRRDKPIQIVMLNVPKTISEQIKLNLIRKGFSQPGRPMR